MSKLPEIFLIREQFITSNQNFVPSLNKNLYILTKDLDVTTRTLNVLATENIKYVGDLVQHTEKSLSELPNMGSKSIDELVRALSELSLYLGMNVINWPPEELKESKNENEGLHNVKLLLNFDQLNFLTKNLRDIDLPTRACNALLNYGFHTMSDLLYTTGKELKRSPNFGNASLVAIEKLLNKYNLKFTDTLEPWDKDISSKIRIFIDNEIQKKKHEVIQSQDKFLEDELKRVCTEAFSISVRRTDSSNNRLLEVFVSRYGLDNSPPKTLELIGQKFNITRERIRQIQKKAEQLIKKSDLPLPLLVKYFNLVKKEIPCTENYINDYIKKINLSNFDFKVSSLIAVAKLFSIPYPKFKIILKNQIEILSNIEDEISIDPIISIINKNISSSGVSNINYIKNRHEFYLNNLSENIIKTLIKNFNNFIWLDKEKNWFTFFSKRNRLVNLILKLATNSPQIKLDVLYSAITKNYRLDKDLKIPKELFLNFCKHVFEIDYILETETIIFKSLFSKISSTQGRMGQNLSEKEKILISVFRDYGPILSWEDMYELLNKHGIGNAHIGQFTQFSPLIQRVDHAMYVLTGSNFKNNKIEVKTVKIELTTNSFPLSNSDYVKNNNAYVEIYKNRKYLETLLYPRPLRLINNNVFGINYDGKFYPIVK